MPSSSGSLSEVSLSMSGDFNVSRARVRPLLSFFSRVRVRRRTLRIGATGVVMDAGLCIDSWSSELELVSFDVLRFGYNNYS